MHEVIQVQDQFYILASSARLSEQNRVLKHGDTFAVFDRFGDIHRIGRGERGLYHGGTRHLSRLELRLLGSRPLLLSSTIREDNGMLTVDLTNPDVAVDGQVVLARDQVHVFRACFLWKGICYERLRLRNYALQPVDVSFDLMFEADFADVFEVRGMMRKRRGELLAPELGPDHVHFRYRGLDDRIRRTTVWLCPRPGEMDAYRARFHDRILPHEDKSYYVTVCCDCAVERSTLLPFPEAAEASAEELASLRRHQTLLETSNGQFNDWLNRSSADLQLMTTRTPHGEYPYAGVPWFSTVFGRDGIITALECLWVNPELARGVLGYLGAHQAQVDDPAVDAEPGKILHETRQGEMAALGEIPFGRYYGSVDATPLYIVLAGAYYERTADLPFLRTIWHNIEAALKWIDCWGDVDGDGFVEYRRRSAKGLAVQGWKDSFDSVFHTDGTLAEGPVALCEVQGYVYAAKRAAAQIAAALGDAEQAASLTQQAEQLRQRFLEAFWCEDISTYAIALDGQKQPCRVRTSNPGHCLFTGIAPPEHAVRVARTLLDEASFSGWGVRTVAMTEERYNPMSYHNGSVWPHDNAILAAGLARYGMSQAVLQIAKGLFDASYFLDLHRMPELFCGFVRRPGEGPTLYPVACAPQSWAAAAVFSLLGSLLGLSIDAPRRQICLKRSVLPDVLNRVWIRNLQVGEATVDLALQRFPIDVGIELLRREGEVEIVVLK
jgi:glycogen debranching enzyme